jgi:hypothetical protein
VESGIISRDSPRSDFPSCIRFFVAAGQRDSYRWNSAQTSKVNTVIAGDEDSVCGQLIADELLNHSGGRPMWRLRKGIEFDFPVLPINMSQSIFSNCDSIVIFPFG